MIRVFMEDISEQAIANLFPNYDRKLNRKPIESREQRGKNTRMIKIYIQSTLSNIVKTGSNRTKAFFSFISLCRHSKWEFFFRLLDNSLIGCRFRWYSLAKVTAKQTEKPPINDRCCVSWKFQVPTIYNFLVIKVKFVILSKSSLLFNTCYFPFCL